MNGGWKAMGRRSTRFMNRLGMSFSMRMSGRMSGRLPMTSLSGSLLRGD